MWAWFTANSVWILIITGFLLVLLFLLRERLLASIVKKIPEEKAQRICRRAAIAFWTVGGLLFSVILLALAAITLSRKGIHSLITPETVQRWLLEEGTMILVILLVGVLSWFALKRFLPPLVSQVVVKTKEESKEGIKKRTDTLIAVFMGVGKILIILAVVFVVLSELNVPIGPILAGLGVVGIAVGFGAQYLIRDLIAGVFILMENQYRVGDVARVADIWGLVEEVNLRKTVLRDLDGGVHHVPNGEIRIASNYTRRFARVNLNVSVDYGTDLDHAIRVINQVGQKLATDEYWGKLIKTVPQVLRVDKFGDSGIEIKILGDVKPIEQWAVTGELRLRLKKAFDAEGIEIPWPHTKVYFGNSPEDMRK